LFLSFCLLRRHKERRHPLRVFGPHGYFLLLFHQWAIFYGQSSVDDIWVLQRREGLSKTESQKMLEDPFRDNHLQIYFTEEETNMY
jgi:hypothetical protein